MRKVLALAALVLACDGDAVGPVEEHGAFVQVSAGTSHTCAVTADGTAFCWGNGAGGQLGRGNESSNTPVQVLRSLQFTRVSAGAGHTCGQTVDGIVACWGDNTRGQLGNASRVGQGAPVEVATAARFASVSAGWFHSCGATAAGAVWCWGANGQGQAGAAIREDVLAPAQLAGAPRLAVVAAGGFHTCGLAVDGAAYCWGSNSLGQLGNGSTADTDVPVAVSGMQRFTSLAAGYTHTCGVATDQRMYCWGSSVHGELGTGGIAGPGLAGARTPQAVVTTLLFTKAAAGYNATCGVATSQDVWCWGRGDDGQLGNGGTRDELLPLRVSVGDLSVPLQLNDVALGVTHACGVSFKAAAYCWGRGGNGELGAGDISRSVLAVRVITE